MKRFRPTRGERATNRGAYLIIIKESYQFQLVLFVLQHIIKTYLFFHS